MPTSSRAVLHHTDANLCAILHTTVVVNLCIIEALEIKTLSNKKHILSICFYCFTVVCKIVHKFASVWCKTALEEVGVSLP